MRFFILSLVFAIVPLVAAQDPPIRITSDALASNIINKVNPTYPPIARAAHVEGTVTLHAVVNTEGHVEQLTVVQGPDMLRSAATEAVRQWTYLPYLLNGVPVSVATTINVTFSFGPPPPPLPPGRIRVEAFTMSSYKISGPMPGPTGPTGVAYLHVVIGKDGHVQDVTAISGPENLTAQGIALVKQWVYRPYLLRREPTEVDTTVSLSFPAVGGIMGGLGLGVPPLPNGRVRVSSGVMAGRRVSGVFPNLCDAGRAQHAATSMVMHVVIDKSGTVTQVSVVSGAEVLRDVSLSAVRGWSYKPFLLDGQPVEVDTTVAFSQSCGA